MRGGGLHVGAQNIVWGDVVGLFFADVVSAQGPARFSAAELRRDPHPAMGGSGRVLDRRLARRVGLGAGAGVRRHSASRARTSIRRRSSRQPRPTWRPCSRIRIGPRVHSATRPTAFSGRTRLPVGGWDIAGFYYRSFSSSPTFYRELTGVASQPLTYQPRYDRIWQAGATFNKDFGSMVLHGEAVYGSGQNYATLDSAPRTVWSRARRSTGSRAWTSPYRGSEPTNFQVFQRIYLDGGDDAVALKSGSLGVSAFVSAKFGGVWEPRLLWIQTFGGGGGLVRPRLNWTPVTNTSLGAGFDIFHRLK